MQELIFKKKVSKGSRFNQVYIPKDMENGIEVGDLVEVRLLRKHLEIYYKNQEKLSDFKEYLIKNVFSTLQRFNEVEYAFIVGSFLYNTIYNDIDIVIIAGKAGLETQIQETLTQKFNQRFHVLLFSRDRLKTMIEKDPLIRSMFHSYICNKRLDLAYKMILDAKHIEFLLMMPSDLLEITLPSKAYYDNMRRLVAIQRFLENRPLDRNSISNEIRPMIDTGLFDKMMNNDDMTEKEISTLRRIIKEKLAIIRELMKHGQG